MVYLLGAFCIFLLLADGILLARLSGMRKAADEIRTAFAERLTEDTNVGIDISISDPKMRRLAADLDRQLKLLRRERIRCAEGDRELKVAVTNISHDLRTPLTAICGYLDLLEQEALPEPAGEYVKIIGNRLDAMKQLTEELFRYSVIVSEEQYESREDVSLNEVLEESTAAFYGALKEKGIAPEIRIPEEAVVRCLSRAALSRIFGNILGNAVKYSGGDLEINLSGQGVITFANRAEGMDEILVGRLFDRFYTVEAGRESTGLGLSIAKVLTERMGGTICASCRNGRLLIEVAFPTAD